MISVAVYCRVSTDKEDQSNSFQSQQAYFRRYIALHPDWKLYRVYADEGISGTSTRKRQQFNCMINDGFCGKYQLILTKEVSRFSRNILDTISYTRQLKARGIGVIFITDGFSSLDPDAELRLSIMGSLAQEESRRTSQRVKWGQTRQMEKGIVFGRSMMGYEVKNGVISVEPAGAEVVRRIFALYTLEKMGSAAIAKTLERERIPTYTGASRWSASRILKILKNEKYAGDLIQKKTYTPDYLTHEKKTNHGQEPVIVIRNHHNPIISRELWNRTQNEIKLRHRQRNRSAAGRGEHLFSGKIRCGCCGASFICRQKKRKDGSTYVFWRCATAVQFGTTKEQGCSVGRNLSDQRALDILRETIRNLTLDRSAIIQNIADLARNAVCSVCDTDTRSEPSSPTRDRRIETAVKAYLSGILTESDLHRIRTQLDKERSVKLTAENNANLPDYAVLLDAMFRCDPPSCIFMKQLLESITVYSDGMIAVKLYHHPEFLVSQ